ncbi:MAG: hypothetical protein ACYSU6_06365, partial [Planctomycetota bacterium]
PQARIAHLVQLADLLARRCGIGHSGSFDTPNSVDRIAQELTINTDQLQQICGDLPEKVAQKSKALGLDSPDNIENYCSIFHDAAAKLARQCIKLSQQNSQLQTASELRPSLAKVFPDRSGLSVLNRPCRARGSKSRCCRKPLRNKNRLLNAPAPGAGNTRGNGNEFRNLKCPGPCRLAP